MTEVLYEGDRVSYSDGWLTTCEIASHPRSLPVLEFEKSARRLQERQALLKSKTYALFSTRLWNNWEEMMSTEHHKIQRVLRIHSA